ncbi:hypothetical protein A7D27_25775 [Pseudomonas sp. 1D4]|nr:hypothetical protein A7D27_25775 [Pseudomonas sp. 1D4]OEC49480.1 hypothetical protein A9G05_25415 [Pseudomonas sp. ENNP23]
MSGQQNALQALEPQNHQLVGGVHAPCPQGNTLQSLAGVGKTEVADDPSTTLQSVRKTRNCLPITESIAANQTIAVTAVAAYNFIQQTN